MSRVGALCVLAVVVTACSLVTRGDAKFANLDRILVRLDGHPAHHGGGGGGSTSERPDGIIVADNTLATMTPAVVGESLATATPAHRIRHNHWAEWQHTRDELQEEGDDDEDDDDDDEEEESADDFQSDVGSRLPITSTVTRSDYSKPRNSNKYEKYWKIYKSSISPTIRISGGEEDPSAQNEVRNHNDRVAKQARCHVPQPRVVRVADHHPSASKSYSPSCTLLHQCAEDTGCCPANQRCGPKDSRKVELFFYATYDVPGISTHHPRKALRIEKLVFYNHTECECQNRRDEMPRDTDPVRNLIPTSYQSHGKSYLTNCKCPSQYSIRVLANGSCSCDCFDKQIDCTKFKRGKEYFNHTDRLCIEMRECNVPTCDFGVYLRRSGRCPRKHERYRPRDRYQL